MYSISPVATSNQSVFSCSDGTSNFDIYVSPRTIKSINPIHLNDYLESRCCHFQGDSQGAMNIIIQYANGDKSSPNWAQRWVDGDVPC